MGLPTLGVYVMLAILVAPALVKVGIVPLAAHVHPLLRHDVLITPPVALRDHRRGHRGAPSAAPAQTAMPSAGRPPSCVLFVYSPRSCSRKPDRHRGRDGQLARGIRLICAAMTVTRFA
jgi:hypothetical protein